ncbi:hypothetical protein [Streptomyces sp900116325]|uniref:hypothetical protein n=1 Tax=Streptomyces sp. 900116325 TaxID=3154295 RepID=UPI00331E378F
MILLPLTVVFPRPGPKRVRSAAPVAMEEPLPALAEGLGAPAPGAENGLPPSASVVR